MSAAEPKKETKAGAGAPVGVGGLDENKINAPSMQEIVMLATICISTLIMWAAGRAACNYHVPGESLTPRQVSLEERTKMPKHVGVELAQVLSGGDFETAAKLVKGDATSLIEKEKAACASCPKSAEEREQIMSVGTVLQANSVDTVVSVRTVAPEGETTRIFGIEREERVWKVTRVYASKEEAELKPAPVKNDAPAAIRRPDGTEGTGATEEEGATEDGATKEKEAIEVNEKKPDRSEPQKSGTK